MPAGFTAIITERISTIIRSLRKNNNVVSNTSKTSYTSPTSSGTSHHGFIETIPVIILSIIALTTLIITNNIKNQQDTRDKAQVYATRYSCGAGGGCVADPNGEFLSLGECSTSCFAPTATPRKSNGSACSGNSECASNFCYYDPTNNTHTCQNLQPTGTTAICPSKCILGCSAAKNTAGTEFLCNNYCSPDIGCTSDQHCSPTSGGGVCLANPTSSPLPIKFRCVTGSYQCVQDTNGEYSTATDCASACKAPPTAVPTAVPTIATRRYSCGAAGGCVADPNGEFLSLGECSTTCIAPTSTPRIANGQACTSNSDCSSNYCYTNPLTLFKTCQNLQPTGTSAICPSKCILGCSAAKNSTGTEFLCNNYCGITCNSDQHCSPTSDGGVCLANPTASPLPIKFRCVTGTYQCVQDTNGAYITASDCSSACKAPPTAVPTATKKPNGSSCTGGSECQSGICNEVAPGINQCQASLPSPRPSNSPTPTINQSCPNLKTATQCGYTPGCFWLSQTNTCISSTSNLPTIYNLGTCTSTCPANSSCICPTTCTVLSVGPTDANRSCGTVKITPTPTLAPTPASQCYFGYSSCASLGRYSASSCSNCPSVASAVCCGAVIPAAAKICTPGQITCSNNTVHSCSSDGTKLTDVPCAAGWTCSGNACVAPSPSPTPGTSSQCYFGASTCASFNRLQGTGCNNCPVGSAACCGGPIPSAAKLCSPGSSVCVSTGAVRICKGDGTGWTDVACASGLTCQGSSCVSAGGSCSQPHGTAISAGSNLYCCDGKIHTGQCVAAIDTGDSTKLPDGTWCFWTAFSGGSCANCSSGTTHKADVNGDGTQEDVCGSGSSGTVNTIPPGTKCNVAAGCYCSDTGKYVANGGSCLNAPKTTTGQCTQTTSCAAAGRFTALNCTQDCAAGNLCCGDKIPDGVQVCTPNARVCLGTGGISVCSADGTGWSSQSCGADTTCVNNFCLPNSMLSPTPSTATTRTTITVGGTCLNTGGCVCNGQIIPNSCQCTSTGPGNCIQLGTTPTIKSITTGEICNDLAGCLCTSSSSLTVMGTKINKFDVCGGATGNNFTCLNQCVPSNSLGTLGCSSIGEQSSGGSCPVSYSCCTKYVNDTNTLLQNSCIKTYNETGTYTTACKSTLVQNGLISANDVSPVSSIVNTDYGGAAYNGLEGLIGTIVSSDPAYWQNVAATQKCGNFLGINGVGDPLCNYLLTNQQLNAQGDTNFDNRVGAAAPLGLTLVAPFAAPIAGSAATATYVYGSTYGGYILGAGATAVTGSNLFNNIANSPVGNAITSIVNGFTNILNTPLSVGGVQLGNVGTAVTAGSTAYGISTSGVPIDVTLAAMGYTGNTSNSGSTITSSSSPCVIGLVQGASTDNNQDSNSKGQVLGCSSYAPSNSATTVHISDSLRVDIIPQDESQQLIQYYQQALNDPAIQGEQAWAIHFTPSGRVSASADMGTRNQDLVTGIQSILQFADEATATNNFNGYGPDLLYSYTNPTMANIAERLGFIKTGQTLGPDIELIYNPNVPGMISSIQDSRSKLEAIVNRATR